MLHTSLFATLLSVLWSDFNRIGCQSTDRRYQSMWSPTMTWHPALPPLVWYNTIIDTLMDRVGYDQSGHANDQYVHTSRVRTTFNRGSHFI